MTTSYPDPAAVSAAAALPSNEAIGSYRRLVSLSRAWGYACFKVAKFAAMLRKSVRTVRYYLAELREAGWIETQTDGRKLFVNPLKPLDEVPAPAENAPAPPRPFLSPSVAHPVAHPNAEPVAPRHIRKTSDTKAIAEEQQTARPVQRPEPDPVPEPAVVVSLTQKGMERNTARRLVALYGEKRAQAALALLAAQKGVKEAAGWLYRAIERGYQAPGNGHAPDHPSNRDTVANLAAARKATSTPVIVRQPVPPPRADLAGMTPKQRLDALMATSTHGPADVRQGANDQ